LVNYFVRIMCRVAVIVKFHHIHWNIVPSKTEWRRLIENGAVRTEDDTKISDPNFLPLKTMVLKIGKRRFVKLVKGN
jgi:tyrosyl-tRNA synthetase